jgi:hypothetical protein
MAKKKETIIEKVEESLEKAEKVVGKLVEKTAKKIVSDVEEITEEIVERGKELVNAEKKGEDSASEKESKKFQYPCVYGMYQDGSIKCLYSSNNDSHFGIPKVIVSMGRYPYPLIDIDGTYGMCNNAFAIKVGSIDEAEKLKKAINSDLFAKVIESTKWGNFQIDYKMFKYLRKDFWKEFLPKSEGGNL